LTSKIHAPVDTNGLPVRLALTPGEAHDNQLAGKLLSRLKSGSMLLADRGYDADWIREFAIKKGAWANIPPKSNRNDPICFSPHLYRVRNLVERFFNKIKQCRRIATPYDKLAANYLAFVQLASIRLWLRANESTPQFASRLVARFRFCPPAARADKQGDRAKQPYINGGDFQGAVCNAGNCPALPRRIANVTRPWRPVRACRQMSD